MTKAVTVLPTLLILILPLCGKGFNFSLSFPPGGRAKPAAVSSAAPFHERGKVIKPNALSEDFLLRKANQPLFPSPHLQALLRPLFETPRDYRIKTVVIDPGHGGHDPGCLGGHSREKHLALGISLKLAAAMKQHYPGLNVILTREADVFIPLHERAAIANRNSADLFISIHCNYMPGSSATKGSETYVMGLHTAEHNLKVAKRENAAILLEDNYEANYDYDPNSAEGHIMLNMFQSAYLEQSILFAEKVERRFAMAQRKSRGVKQAGFVVLKETTMPSVLVETGFLSNRAEEAFLMTEQGQSVVAAAMLAAFEEYRRDVEDSPEATPLSGAPLAMPEQVQPVEGQPKPAAEPVTPPPLAKGRHLVARSPQAATEAPSTPAKRETPAASPPPVAQERKIISLQPQEESVIPTSPPPSAAPSLDDLGIALHVQIAAAQRPLDTSGPKWNDTGYLIEVVKEGAYYKYQAKNFTSLRHAYEAQLALEARGFEGAFIVAYQNGSRISIEQVRQALGLP